jgi:hypothetical protein
MKPIAILITSMVFFGLIPLAMGIDHPVEPFQKAKALALMEGKPYDGKTGKMYILVIKGWGMIAYKPEGESIILSKGTQTDNSSISYTGKLMRYYVGRDIKGSKPENTNVEWSVAWEIAEKYLREIETVREK